MIDEADNLFGFNLASGVPASEWGKSVNASPVIIQALEDEATRRNLTIVKRVCHHLENYHAVRNPEKYTTREPVLRDQKKGLERKDKGESWDMETAVLFRVAADFDKHAAAVLQTVHKENSSIGPYEVKYLKEALQLENDLFFDYIFSTLVRLSDRASALPE